MKKATGVTGGLLGCELGSAERMLGGAVDLALLLDLGCLTAQVTQVVQLRATNLTARQNIDLVNVWGVHWEGTLHTNTEGNLTDGEGLADAGVLTLDHNTTENLHTGLGALDDLDVNVEGVTGAELWNIVAQLCCIDLVENMHGVKSFARLDRGSSRLFDDLAPTGSYPQHYELN